MFEQLLTEKGRGPQSILIMENHSRPSEVKGDDEFSDGVKGDVGGIIQEKKGQQEILRKENSRGGLKVVKREGSSWWGGEKQRECRERSP